MSSRVTPGLFVNVHESLKQQIAKDCSTHNAVGISDMYFTLDSFVKGLYSDPPKGIFTWNFYPRGTTSDGNVGVFNDIESIIEMECYPFAFPVIPEVPYVLVAALGSPANTIVLIQNNTNSNVDHRPVLYSNQYPTTLPAQYPSVVGYTPHWINNPYTQIPFLDKITINVPETGQQSFSDRLAGARHNFDFIVTPKETQLIASPLLPESGTFIFTTPLIELRKITLEFRNHDIPIKFEQDVFQATLKILAGAPPNYVTFTVTGHNLLAQDRVFFTVANTGNSFLDTYINRAEGHVVNGIPSAPQAAGTPIPTTFYTDPAIDAQLMTGLTVPVSGINTNMYVAKRRLLIPFRMRKITDKPTNGIVST
jgi:hypothetical protein